MEAASQTINHIENPNLLATKIIVRTSSSPGGCCPPEEQRGSAFFSNTVSASGSCCAASIYCPPVDSVKTLHPPGVFLCPKGTRMPAHLWKTTVGGHLRFCSCRCKKHSEGGGLGYQPEEHYGQLAVCKIQRKDEFAVLCFKRHLRLCAVRGQCDKLFAFQQSGGQREATRPVGCVRLPAVSNATLRYSPIRPCGHILRRKAAAVSPRRCRFDHFQLRGVLPARTRGRRSASSSAVWKVNFPAIRAASLRTAISQTIGALRAGSVRGPCTELVSQLIGRVCGVAVFAAAAK